MDTRRIINNFYVYHLVDPKISLPFYVGKGKGYRLYEHENDTVRGITPNKNKLLYYKIKKILKNSGKINYVKIKENMSEREALTLEMGEISKYGRRNIKTGILCNLTDGGEGSTGYRHSTKHRNKLKLKNPGGIKTSIPVLQFDLHGNFVREWASCSKAAKILFGLGNSGMSKITSSAKKYHTYKNFIWIFKHDSQHITKDNKVLDFENIQIVKEHYTKKLKQIDINGNVIKTWDAIKDACKELNILPSRVSMCNKYNLPVKGYFLKIHE